MGSNNIVHLCKGLTSYKSSFDAAADIADSYVSNGVTLEARLCQICMMYHVHVTRGGDDGYGG